MEPLIKILVSENKSRDPVRFYRNRVRIYAGEDYSYGLWVEEDRLFEYLGDEDKRNYLATTSQTIQVNLGFSNFEKLLNTSSSPYGRTTLLNYLKNEILEK